MINEDNKSCIALIKKGRPVAEATRHLQSSISLLWMSFQQEHRDSLIYLRTNMMIADLLTKGVTDALFRKFSDMLMTSYSQCEHYKLNPKARRVQLPAKFERIRVVSEDCWSVLYVFLSF